MQQLNNQLNELEQVAAQYAATNTAVSRASVGWHVAHTTVVIGNVLAMLEKSDPKAYQWRFKWIKYAVFMLNKIPRGKGKAPSASKPQGDITPETLAKNIARARQKIAAIEGISPDKFFEHPYFGNLRTAETLKFLGIHTEHHLAIVRDILRRV